MRRHSRLQHNRAQKTVQVSTNVTSDDVKRTVFVVHFARPRYVAKGMVCPRQFVSQRCGTFKIEQIAKITCVEKHLFRDESNINEKEADGAAGRSDPLLICPVHKPNH